MLVPLTRQVFEKLVPLAATGDQYKYCWGKPSDFLQRLLISVVGIVVFFILRFILPAGFELIEFIPGVIVGLYWLWAPIYWAGRRNRELRRYKYSGFWRGEVLDAFISEEMIGKEETVNKQGELVIIENRERCLNLEVGDENGFTTQIQVPLQRSHRSIRPRDTAEMVVLSNRTDLSRISKVSDIYLPDYDLWISDYPYIRRDVFAVVRQRLSRRSRYAD
ncbi:MAG: FUSC family protein [Leptolyngbyaceae cyanobacterium SL_7_1]|nr:FUSC family protein [Leptolyngbyaceae cyanobacterium SL_7_1]